MNNLAKEAMKKILITGIIAAGMLISSAASAQVTVFGSSDCGQWINAPALSKKTWLLGFLSGLNSAMATSKPKHDPLEQLSSAEQAYLWMDNYCRNNPLEQVIGGGQELFIELSIKAKKK